MYEKILDINNERSFKETKFLIDKHVDRLKAVNKEQWTKDWGIYTAWDTEQNKLIIKSKTFKINGYFEFKEKRMLGFVDVPFYLLLFKNAYSNTLRSIVKDALNGSLI